MAISSDGLPGAWYYGRCFNLRSAEGSGAVALESQPQKLKLQSRLLPPRPAATEGLPEGYAFSVPALMTNISSGFRQVIFIPTPVPHDLYLYLI
jgi:hypothetical protein